jgi:2-polyprenyl-3-methyl-5-hydroxy-6-metoxy-1,4-benzoquinol methylase
VRQVPEQDSYWEPYWKLKSMDYTARKLRADKEGAAGPHGVIGRFFFDHAVQNYHDYIMWNVIYKKFMPKKSGLKILEIGSAPGHHLVRLRKEFGYTPYGVECSARGAEINRQVFREFSVDPDGVICEDFFSEKFQKDNKGKFDIVISRGFIEDFKDADVSGVIDKHLDLLRPGGYLFVVIPNFRGIYGIGLSVLCGELKDEVNFEIMKKENMEKAFSGKNVQTLFCGYFGTFNCGDRYSPRKDAAARALLAVCNGVQRSLNVIFRTILRDRGAESAFLSPYIAFVGVKNG